MAHNRNLKADAILFDKDGTLIDFDAFWVSLSEVAVTDILTRFHQDVRLMGEILEGFGIHNGVTDVNGIVCKGTYAQMAQIVHDTLLRHGCACSFAEVETTLLDAYHKNMHTGQVKPTCPDLPLVLSTLKQRGKKLAVATTDNRELTLFCLEQLGIAHLFDRIYTDDGVFPPKPQPDIALDFCARYAPDQAQVLMVGDTQTDVLFAQNAGIRMVGVARTPEHEAVFHGRADAIVRSLSELLEILE